jgi:hypothetical protein
MKNNLKIQDYTQSLQSCVSVSVTDLRIGNYYSYDDNAIKLDGSLLAAYLQNDCDLYLYPILLTEEWLDKLKFDENHWATNWILNEMPIPTGVEFVHQLQNLYHALTGCDLQIGNLTEH